jgi:hypothetical protein
VLPWQCPLGMCCKWIDLDCKQDSIGCPTKLLPGSAILSVW